MTDRHLDTKAGVLRFCELRRREMAEDWKRVGRYEVMGHSFGGFVFATHEIRKPSHPGASPEDWKTGPKLDHVEARPLYLPECIDALIEQRQLTALWGYVIRSYAKLTRAIGTLIMSETWHVHGPPLDGRTPLEARKDLPEDLADADNRQESLIMLLEHSAAGQVSWFAAIKRNPSRLEPWVDRGGHASEGRLVNLVDYRS